MGSVEAAMDEDEGGGVEPAAATMTATCACCGIGEECTAGYVARVAAQFAGAWVCGLCGVGLEAATRAHAEFVARADAARSSGHAVQVAQALLQLLKKLLAAAPGAAVLPLRRQAA
ncbi:unnamed protein product [Urochloa humidicola]